jgi:DNA replication and repair protein RecF
LGRVRAGAVGREALVTWDHELARHGIALRDDRAQVVAAIADGVAVIAGDLGLSGVVELRYRPRTKASDAAALAAEFAERADADLERGFTTHGPHRDDLALLRERRDLRIYGSQGEQRLGLLALLLAERGVLEVERGAPPLMLLDDVMSELDADRRARLVERLRAGGQSVITTTDLAHVPDAGEPDVERVAIADGAVLAEVPE